MPIDPRLRDGLQRSMSTLDVDAEEHLLDARRRGRRRLVARRLSIAVSFAASVALVAASAAVILDSPSRRTHVPATTLSSQSPPADPPRADEPVPGEFQQQAILGSWQSEYICQDLVHAYEQAGVGRFAPRALGELNMLKGAADRPAGDPHLCQGARRIQRTHVFEPNGAVLNYQGSAVVDECTCFTLVGDHTFVNLADPGYPDISLSYEISGDMLTFDVMVPHPCGPRCEDQVQTVVGQYAVGPWHRVTNPAPIR